MRLPDDVRAMLETPTFWCLATLGVDGVPHITRVWAGARHDLVLINTALGRAMEQNLRQRPAVAIAPLDSGSPYEYVEIRGCVIDVIEGAAAAADIDALARQYLGESRYPWHRPGELRVSFLVEPRHLRRYRFQAGVDLGS